VRTPTLEDRRRTADRIFRGALIFNTSLTVFWLVVMTTGGDAFFFQEYRINLGQIFGGIVFYYIIWGFIWYGIKAALLKYVVFFSKEDLRQAFSSRMRAPYDVADLLQRYSERKIRIVDMIGRRGRFITLGMTGFFYLYASIEADPTADFATKFLGNNLFDAVATSWILLGLYYADGFLAGAFFGPQSRVMDGVLARANCLLITTLWTVFKFVMVPIGTKLAALFSREEFAVVFALIWGSYMVNDTLAEVGGSILGKQRIRVWGIGDVNRKSIAGVVSGFAGALAFCVWVVLRHGLSAPWIGLAIAIAISTTALELFSPRGTDDFTMATANALICLGFGILVR
jgi:hypothetical protein